MGDTYLITQDFAAEKARQVEADAPKTEDRSLPGWVREAHSCIKLCGPADRDRALGEVKGPRDARPTPNSSSRRPASSLPSGKISKHPTSSSPRRKTRRPASFKSRICLTRTPVWSSTKLGSGRLWEANGTRGLSTRRRRCRGSPRRWVPLTSSS